MWPAVYLIPVEPAYSPCSDSESSVYIVLVPLCKFWMVKLPPWCKKDLTYIWSSNFYIFCHFPYSLLSSGSFPALLDHSTPQAQNRLHSPHFSYPHLHYILISFPSHIPGHVINHELSYTDVGTPSFSSHISHTRECRSLAFYKPN